MTIALRALASTVVLATVPASIGHATETVHLYAGFSPDRPRANATLSFGFTVDAAGAVPSPLTGVHLHLPAGIGLATTTLGLDACEANNLYKYGPGGCPPNSHVGYGEATTEVPFGPETLTEHVTINAYRGPEDDAHPTVLFFAEGTSPVFADIAFPGILLAETIPGPYSGRLDTVIPTIESIPAGPNVSVVRFKSTIGPKDLVYYVLIDGHRRPIRPRGILVPATCPHGGFPFAADFTFEDGTHTTVHATVPCPTEHGARP